MRRSFVVLALAFATLLTPARGHHSFAAEFDSSKPITLRGTVTKMDWINPHSWIHIEVKGADGAATKWMIECGSPNTLYRRGFTKDSLPVGTEIVVDGYLAKDGGNRANGRDVTFNDGKKLFLGSSSGETEK